MEEHGDDVLLPTEDSVVRDDDVLVAIEDLFVSRYSVSSDNGRESDDDRLGDTEDEFPFSRRTPRCRPSRAVRLPWRLLFVRARLSEIIDVGPSALNEFLSRSSNEPYAVIDTEYVANVSTGGYDVGEFDQLKSSPTKMLKAAWIRNCVYALKENYVQHLKYHRFDANLRDWAWQTS